MRRNSRPASTSRTASRAPSSSRIPSGDDNSWAALTQGISPQNYAGQRIRFRARVRTQDVGNWAGLWMRVDGQSRPGVAFYNSQDKPIKGTTDWQERSVVLDVPQDATAIVFGVIGAGKGTVWIDQLALDTVGQDVPVDSMQPQRPPCPPRRRCEAAMKTLAATGCPGRRTRPGIGGRTRTAAVRLADYRSGAARNSPRAIDQDLGVKGAKFLRNKAEQ
jgi:hypothetical protein